MDYEKLLEAFDNFQNTGSSSGTTPPRVSLLSSTAVRPAKLCVPSNRIAGYGRRSSSKDESDSFDRQKRDIYHYCMVEFGCEPGHFFFDKHVSGRTAVRPDFIKLIALIEKGELDVVVIEDVDRAARSLAVIANFHELCQRHKVAIHSRKKSGPIGLSDIAMGGYMSALQVENLRKRVMDGRLQAARKGKVIGKMPFGYIRSNDGEWIVDERYRDIIKYMFDAKRAGMHTDLIARIVGARAVMQGIPANSFSGSQIWKFLTNWKYTGLQLFGLTKCELNTKTGEYRTEATPPEEWSFAENKKWQIVDRETFFAVLALRGKPTKRKLKRPRALVPNALTVCGHCGSRMMTWKARQELDSPQNWVLRCPARACVNTLGAPLAEVEDQVLNAVGDLLADPNCPDKFRESLDIQRGRVAQELNDERAAIEEQFASLTAHRKILMEEILERESLRVTNSQRTLAGLSPMPGNGKNSPLRHFTDEELDTEAGTAKSGLEAVKLKMSSMRPAPAEIDMKKMPLLRQAYETLRHDKQQDGERLDIDLRILTDAQAAIANFISTIRISKVLPGHARRYEVVVSLAEIFGEAMSEIGQDRISCVTVIHPARIHAVRGRNMIGAAVEAYSQKAFAATDEQFAAVEPAISPAVRELLAAGTFSTREFIDLIFLVASASINVRFMHIAAPDKWNTISQAIQMSCDSGDGTWHKVFRALKERFPEVYRLMNVMGYPNHLLAIRQPCHLFAPLTARQLELRRANARQWRSRPHNRERDIARQRAGREKKKAARAAAA